jgi:uridine kinase
MEIAGEKRISESEWRIVEGSYSHHPKFGDYADLRVFCSVPEDEQMRRILARNGEKMAEMFREKWIPMEESYFKAYGIREKADLLI